VRKKNYVRAEECRTDAERHRLRLRDYARCLDIALELIGHDQLDEKRRDAEPRSCRLRIARPSTRHEQPGSRRCEP
jgi:hypothetical protein